MKLVGQGFEMNKLVSSANRTGWDKSVIIFVSSFILRRKTKGPRTEACGMPHLAFTQSKEILF
jgi:hypothetical protein